nr:hypothetical protein [Escherichia coli]
MMVFLRCSSGFCFYQLSLSPSRNGTSLDLQAGLEARVRENITLGVQGGYAHSVSGSSAEGYNGQATLNVTF